ncbi:MAG: DNA repair protein RecN [Lachnospiraceae bacterium]|nr:DNA repair protein RecN [Lachnospiraceae bacterium]
MLQQIHIKNLALIDEEEIEFSDGINILTGETGAGKSVILGSINLALGARADSDMIRTGAEWALAELTFLLDDDEKKRVLDMGFEPDSDGTLFISRKISPGKSVCRVMGETVTLAALRELAESLITIHGQNDQKSLLGSARQREILDGYIGAPLAALIEPLKEMCSNKRETLDELAKIGDDTAARTREMDLLAYEIDEIEKASLTAGEEERLESEYRRMSNAKKIGEAVGGARNLISGEDGESLSDALGRARREIAAVAQFDDDLGVILDQMDDADSILQDISRSLADAAEDLIFDDQTFRETEERLDLIHRLQSKYGATIQEILDQKEDKERRLCVLENAEAFMEESREKLKKLDEDMRRQCRKITETRKKGALELAEKIRVSLVDCNFLDVRFEIAVESDENAITGDGWDRIRFDIQTNPGEAVRPLDQIASGGELSRIMLGIKTVFADRKDTKTLIFDEIDAGISGKTAWKVAEKLGSLSDRHQIICITHLPQIAAMADHHFVINKEFSGERTLTRIREIDRKESVGELARLLSADEVTEEVTKNASQLKERADKAKGKK